MQLRSITNVTTDSCFGTHVLFKMIQCPNRGEALWWWQGGNFCWHRQKAEDWMWVNKKCILVLEWSLKGWFWLFVRYDQAVGLCANILHHKVCRWQCWEGVQNAFYLAPLVVYCLYYGWGGVFQKLKCFTPLEPKDWDFARKLPKHLALAIT